MTGAGNGGAQDAGRRSGNAGAVGRGGDVSGQRLCHGGMGPADPASDAAPQRHRKHAWPSDPCPRAWGRGSHAFCGQADRALWRAAGAVGLFAGADPGSADGGFLAEPLDPCRLHGGFRGHGGLHGCGHERASGRDRASPSPGHHVLKPRILEPRRLFRRFRRGLGHSALGFASAVIDHCRRGGRAGLFSHALPFVARTRRPG